MYDTTCYHCGIALWLRSDGGFQDNAGETRCESNPGGPHIPEDDPEDWPVAPVIPLGGPR